MALHIRTLCPSGLRGWTQVPLARAAWAQIPQVSCGGHSTTRQQLGRWVVKRGACPAAIQCGACLRWLHICESVLIPCVGGILGERPRRRFTNLGPADADWSEGGGSIVEKNRKHMHGCCNSLIGTLGQNVYGVSHTLSIFKYYLIAEYLTVIRSPTPEGPRAHGVEGDGRTDGRKQPHPCGHSRNTEESAMARSILRTSCAISRVTV